MFEEACTPELKAIGDEEKKIQALEVENADGAISHESEQESGDSAMAGESITLGYKNGDSDSR